VIVFDCDGTLIDSEYPYNKALSDALVREGFDHYTVGVINERFAGRVFHETITIIESEIDRPLSAGFQSYCLELCEDYIARFRKPVDGAADVIRDLQPRYEMGVASNGFRGHVIDSLVFLKLDHIFSDERIFTKCQVARPKPHPDLYHFAAAQMGGEPEKMIAVEDSLPGVQSAVAAGFHVIGFVGVARNPPRMRDVLNQAGAHIIYDDWAAIGDYIRKI
jgi:beta-phosphoglucomutase-like phosphatase (HAD superfamily)